MCRNLNNCCTAGSCKCNQQHPELVIGRSYKLRNGMKGVITGKTPDPKYPWVGYFIYNGDDCGSLMWTSSGVFYQLKYLSEFDIIEEWKEPKKGVRSLIIYKYPDFREISSDSIDPSDVKDAVSRKERAGAVILAIKEVTWAEGEGLP